MYTHSKYYSTTFTKRHVYGQRRDQQGVDAERLQALIARGEHPSLDAIRIELGKTGSKTTKLRYVKKIENELTRLYHGNLRSRVGCEGHNYRLSRKYPRARRNNNSGFHQESRYC